MFYIFRARDVGRFVLSSVCLPVSLSACTGSQLNLIPTVDTIPTCNSLRSPLITLNLTLIYVATTLFYPYFEGIWNVSPRTCSSASYVVISLFNPYFNPILSLFYPILRQFWRYLKRIFKDLFERQAFEDDGVYDWDMLKKKQEQGNIHNRLHNYLHT